MEILRKIAVFWGFTLLMLLICSPVIADDDLAVQYINEGNNYAMHERYSEAVASYEKSLSIDPNNKFAWFNRGNALVNLYQYKEAIASYDKAIAIDPKFTSAWDARGNAFSETGRWTEAFESYNNETAIDPNNKAAWNNRGTTLIALGRYYDAAKSFEKALTIDPNYATAWFNLGTTLSMAADRINNTSSREFLYKGAITSYDRALIIDPNNQEVILNRDIALFELRENQNRSQSVSAISIEPSPKDSLSKHTLIPPIQQQTQQQTESIPLLYAPIIAIILMGGIAVLNWRKVL